MAMITRRAAVMIALAAFTFCGSQAFAGEHGDKKDEPPSPYIQFEDFNVSVFGDRDVRGILTLSMSLQVLDLANHDKVAARQPLLRDAYIRSVGQFASARTDLRQPINLAQLDALLQRTTDKVLGPKMAKVLIAAVAIRPL
jgi:flagellar basal body-associated protein FliL